MASTKGMVSQTAVPQTQDLFKTQFHPHRAFANVAVVGKM
jgi:hypothetical protein